MIAMGELRIVKRSRVFLYDTQNHYGQPKVLNVGETFIVLSEHTMFDKEMWRHHLVFSRHGLSHIGSQRVFDETAKIT